MRAILISAALAYAAACSGETTSDPPERPTYVEDVAPILARACAGCHGVTTTTREPRNCVRVDHWDSAPDGMQLCSDPEANGNILGVRDAAALIVDGVVTRRMPPTGGLSDAEIDTFARWRGAGFPKRAHNAPPAIDLPANDLAACAPDCLAAFHYTITDPDDDSVRWSLGYRGPGGAAGMLAPPSVAAANTGGDIAVDAESLAAGTYALTATLDDGTVILTVDAAGQLVVPATHDAMPTVALLSPRPGETIAGGVPMTIVWSGADADDASLVYDVSVTGPVAQRIGMVTAGSGEQRLAWTPPGVAAPTPVRFVVTARDPRGALATARSDGDITIAATPQTVSFAAQIQPILSASCTFSTCHDASSPAANLVLEPGAAYGALVGVFASDGCTSYRRVAPGAPDASYLLMKLAGAGACFTGSRMPKSEPPLTAVQMQLIRDWIANGAPNN